LHNLCAIRFAAETVYKAVFLWSKRDAGGLCLSPACAHWEEGISRGELYKYLVHHSEVRT